MMSRQQAFQQLVSRMGQEIDRGILKEGLSPVAGRATVSAILGGVLMHISDEAWATIEAAKDKPCSVPGCDCHVQGPEQVEFFSTHRKRAIAAANRNAARRQN